MELIRTQNRGGGVTPHDSLYREALLERGYLQLYEGVGIHF